MSACSPGAAAINSDGGKVCVTRLRLTSSAPLHDNDGRRRAAECARAIERCLLERAAAGLQLA